MAGAIPSAGRPLGGAVTRISFGNRRPSYALKRTEAWFLLHEGKFRISEACASTLRGINVRS